LDEGKSEAAAIMMTAAQLKRHALRNRIYRARRKQGQTVVTWAMDPCVIDVLVSSGVLSSWAEDSQVIVQALNRYFELISGQEERRYDDHCASARA
jgi:hypothetical protein